MTNKKPLLVWLIAAYFIYQGAIQLFYVVTGLDYAPIPLLLPHIGFTALYLGAAFTLILRIGISRLLIFAIFGYSLVMDLHSIINMRSALAHLGIQQWAMVLIEFLFLAFAAFYTVKLNKQGYYQPAKLT
ncbi:hypothetical protein [Agarivorans sp. DSG3-1]|uniref:hypothetical protein n=1 Tax=Agarivorans sp. DSG3-1 TaxID=3342249 RepID=UPI00398ECAE9